VSNIELTEVERQQAADVHAKRASEELKTLTRLEGYLRSAMAEVEDFKDKIEKTKRRAEVEHALARELRESKVEEELVKEETEEVSPLSLYCRYCGVQSGDHCVDWTGRVLQKFSHLKRSDDAKALTVKKRELKKKPLTVLDFKCGYCRADKGVNCVMRGQSTRTVHHTRESQLQEELD
jgi:hypothetical protein